MSSYCINIQFKECCINWKAALNLWIPTEYSLNFSWSFIDNLYNAGGCNKNSFTWFMSENVLLLYKIIITVGKVGI